MYSIAYNRLIYGAVRFFFDGRLHTVTAGVAVAQLPVLNGTAGLRGWNEASNSHQLL